MAPRTMVVAAVSFATAEAKHPIRQSLVDRINGDPHSTWTAANPAKNPLARYSEEEISGLMGTHLGEPIAKDMFDVEVGDIPDSYDARSNGCTGSVRNQARCGSCWAFAAAETLTDNLCAIGKKSPELSAQDLVSCDSSDHACKGGSLLNVWSYIDSSGIVSQDCMPYESGGLPGNETIPDCPLPGCSGSGDGTPYKCPVAHTMLDSDVAIQQAVMTVSAVETGFVVMEDFMNYESGIYSYKEGVQLGGHAVKIVGWGTQYGGPWKTKGYWIVQNSWGPSWGESGYFRIVNWHQDKESGFAIGGGMACVQGPTPAPPAPPGPSPSSCKDIVSYCKDEIKIPLIDCKKKSYLVPVCKKTCGCCEDFDKPEFCPKDADSIVV